VEKAMSPEMGTASLSKVAEGLAKELFQSAKGVAAKSVGKFQAEFGVGFEKYVQRNQNKCRFVKTLLHRIDPIPIEQAYVEPSLKISKEIVLGGAFPEKLNELKNIVIVGNGGSGKSMFIKKLFLELCEYPLGRIPLFIELRDLNARDDKDLFKLVHHQWSELIPSFKSEALEAGFRSGKFVLLLDGLDEVDKQERDKTSKNIIEFSYKFQLLNLLRNLYSPVVWEGSRHFVDMLDLQAWRDLLGDAGEEFVHISLIPNSKFSKTPLAQKIVRMRSEVLRLDSDFRKKNKNRDSFVKSLLNK
jgi:hypothetical protein